MEFAGDQMRIISLFITLTQHSPLDSETVEKKRQNYPALVTHLVL